MALLVTLYSAYLCHAVLLTEIIYMLDAVINTHKWIAARFWSVGSGTLVLQVIS